MGGLGGPGRAILSILCPLARLPLAAAGPLVWHFNIVLFLSVCSCGLVAHCSAGFQSTLA